MRIMKMASKWMSRTSPMGLLLAGTALVMVGPTLKNIVRNTAVTVTRGVLSVTDTGQNVTSKMKESWDDIVAEARAHNTDMSMDFDDMSSVVGAGAGGAMGAGLGASMGGPMGGAMGAAVGGGLGSMVGATVGADPKEDSKHHKGKHNNKNHSDHHEDKKDD